MSKRLTRKMTDVIAEVKTTLKTEFDVTQKQIDAWRQRVDGLGLSFPGGSHLVDVDQLWIDYEVQRDVISKHVLRIMKNYDPRLCGPTSGCRITNSKDPAKVYTYDGQHRTIATALLGFQQIPVLIVETDDPAFPSYAFEMLNDTGIKKLYPSDLHRNALTRFKLGSRDERNVTARTLQDQFDKNGIDLEDKNTRQNTNLRGDNAYFFSHFKYAYKGIELDRTGKTLNNILSAIKTVFAADEEIDQGVYIGLYEIARLDRARRLPRGWMQKVLEGVKKSYNRSSVIHTKAKAQWAHISPGASWSAPVAMSNFIREVYEQNGGKIKLPTHGAGASMQVSTNPSQGLFPKAGN